MPPNAYPEHLRASLDALPACAGVYVFHGDDDALPLYIGKSVNLRSRVLAHLRNPDEARLLRQTRRISHVRTAGEIGALLLEARLIKERQPLYNQRLRRYRQLYSLRLNGAVPDVVHSKDLDFASTPGLYGLFPGRRAALETLRELADAHRLCHGALGLERLARGRPCFRAMLGKCAGLCRGAEAPDAHRARLLSALQAMAVVAWPYRGAVALVERDALGAQLHVIRNWCYLGTVDAPRGAAALSRSAPGFDADGYRILCGPILKGDAELVAL